MGVTIGVYGINNYFTVPYTESKSNILLLDKLIFLRFLVPLPLPEEENMQSEWAVLLKSATELFWIFYGILWIFPCIV